MAYLPPHILSTCPTGCLFVCQSRGFFLLLLIYGQVFSDIIVQMCFLGYLIFLIRYSIGYKSDFCLFVCQSRWAHSWFDLLNRIYLYIKVNRLACPCTSTCPTVCLCVCQWRGTEHIYFIFFQWIWGFKQTFRKNYV